MDKAERLAMARQIKPRRNALGWSQDTLADKAGLSLRTVQAAEKAREDKVPTPATLMLVDAALGGSATGQRSSRWSDDVESLVNIIGLFVENLDGDQRKAWIDHLTRVVVLRDLDA